MRFAAAAALAALTACGRYADFTLPPAAGPSHGLAWTARPEPVLTQPNAVDALNPSVARRGNLLFNLYSVFDGAAWRTHLATSGDGLAWARLGPVLSPAGGGYIAANGHVLDVNGEFFYWFHSGEREQPVIGLARSRDGKAWTPAAAAVLEGGPFGSWDERGVADPYVVAKNGVFYLFYLGQDRARRQRLGIARSPDGIRWEKMRANPILELGAGGSFDENGLGEPAVWEAGGEWRMLYTGRDRGERRRMGIARSRDGAAWEKLAQPLIEGGEPWNSAVMCDATVLAEDGRARVWFGGGSKPRPDENIEGKIGYGELR